MGSGFKPNCFFHRRNFASAPQKFPTSDFTFVVFEALGSREAGSAASFMAFAQYYSNFSGIKQPGRQDTFRKPENFSFNFSLVHPAHFTNTAFSTVPNTFGNSLVYGVSFFFPNSLLNFVFYNAYMYFAS